MKIITYKSSVRDSISLKLHGFIVVSLTAI